MRNRIEAIDIAKGIGIILVVLGHLSGVKGHEPLYLSSAKFFLYQFHIPLFFFLSGIFFRPEDSWKVFLKKKLLRLYVPFVAANLIFLIGDEVLRAVSGIAIIPVDEIKHLIKIILMMASSPMGGATWFLRSLLLVSVLYKLCNELFRGRKWALLSACLAITVVGLFVPANMSFSVVLTALFFFCCGHLSACQLCSIEKMQTWQLVGLAVFCFAVLAVSSRYNRVDMALGIYSNYYLAIPMALIGIMMILFVSQLLCGTRAGQILNTVGCCSLCVLIGHFAAFKIVTGIQVLAQKDAGVSALLSHPCYNVSSLNWLLYLFVGVVVPIVVTTLFNNKTGTSITR